MMEWRADAINVPLYIKGEEIELGRKNIECHTRLNKKNSPLYMVVI